MAENPNLTEERAVFLVQHWGQPEALAALIEGFA